MSLSAAPLAFVLLAFGPAVASTAQERPEAGLRPKETAPSFTDEDLARYRDERLRREANESGPDSPPSSADSDAEGGSAMAGAEPSMARPASASVVLQDLNKTLPAEAREKAEAAARRFVTFFEVPVEGELVIPLRFFPDMEAYREHLARNVAGDVMWTGFYDPTRGEIVVGGSTDSLAILIHEMNHFIVDRVFEEAPVWLDEGLAEYFEGSQADSGGLVISTRRHHLRQLAEWLDGDRQPDLRQLLGPGGWTSLAPGFGHERRVRALAWSVVDFLMQNAEWGQTLQLFMARLKDHRGLHSLQALETTFPGGAGAFERRWLEHVETRARGR